jgi:hypothetical protein
MVGVRAHPTGWLIVCLVLGLMPALVAGSWSASPIPTSAPVGTEGPGPVLTATFAPSPAKMAPPSQVAVSVTASSSPATHGLPAPSPASTFRPAPAASPIALGWTSMLLPEVDSGAANRRGAVATDVAGGGPGIVVVGEDDQYDAAGSITQSKGTPASWVSSDAGRSWRESLLAMPPAVGAGRQRDQFSALTAHAGVFVAATTGSMWRSVNGTEWTPVSVGPTTPPGLEAGGLGFLAFRAPPARDSTTGSRYAEVWTSTDGTTWQKAPDQVALRDFCPWGLAVSSTRAVALGTRCTHDAVDARPAVVLVSTDGRAWRRTPAPTLVLGEGGSLSYTGGRFVWIGYDRPTSTTVWSSKDGLSWRRVSTLPAATGWSADRIVGLVKLGSVWIAAGYRVMGPDDCYPIAWTSADLVNWRRKVLPMVARGETCYYVNELTAAAGRAVAVGQAWDMAGGSVPLVWISAR